MQHFKFRYIYSNAEFQLRLLGITKQTSKFLFHKFKKRRQFSDNLLLKGWWLIWMLKAIEYFPNLPINLRSASGSISKEVKNWREPTQIVNHVKSLREMVWETYQSLLVTFDSFIQSINFDFHLILCPQSFWSCSLPLVFIHPASCFVSWTAPAGSFQLPAMCLGGGMLVRR